MSWPWAASAALARVVAEGSRRLMEARTTQADGGSARSHQLPPWPGSAMGATMVPGLDMSSWPSFSRSLSPQTFPRRKRMQAYKRTRHLFLNVVVGHDLPWRGGPPMTEAGSSTQCARVRGSGHLQGEKAVPRTVIVMWPDLTTCQEQPPTRENGGGGQDRRDDRHLGKRNKKIVAIYKFEAFFMSH